MTTEPSGLLLFYALIGGFLPALFWLWFWLREDKLHPEPRGRILFAFVAGMVGVAIVYPLEKAALSYLGWSMWTIIAWAAIEEIIKFGLCYLVAIRSRDYQEPIDALEYLITTALGFSAVENSLFILSPLIQGDIVGGIITGNMRFVGASLVHVVSSAALGYVIGREFYARSRFWKFMSVIFGLALATTLHAIFNYFIIYQSGTNVFVVFGFVWAAAILLLVLFDKIKKIKAPSKI